MSDASGDDDTNTTEEERALVPASRKQEKGSSKVLSCGPIQLLEPSPYQRTACFGHFMRARNAETGRKYLAEVADNIPDRHRDVFKGAVQFARSLWHPSVLHCYGMVRESGCPPIALWEHVRCFLLVVCSAMGAC